MKTDATYTTKECLIKTILGANTNLQINWEAFKERFNSVYPNFFASILTNDIALSKKEEHLIMLEKLKINTATIAIVLDVLPESVYTSRYRMNKKINKSTIELQI